MLTRAQIKIELDSGITQTIIERIHMWIASTVPMIAIWMVSTMAVMTAGQPS